MSGRAGSERSRLQALGAALSRPRRWPVRVRLAIVSATLTAVILIGFAAVVGRLTSDRLDANFRQELRDTADRLASSYGAQIGGREIESPSSVLDAVAHDAVIRVVTSDGEPIEGGNPLGVDLGPPSPDGEVRDGPGELEVADSPISTNSLTVEPALYGLYVQYARDHDEVQTTIDRLWLFLAAGVGIGTLLAGLAGMALASRAMQPISRLTATTREIATTRDPSMRIPDPETDDEVAELARTLDEMLRELDAARSETEQTIKRQREFVADASHELRTPLTSILANLELLQESLERDSDADERAATESALRSSLRMSRLVGDLLILARADAGRLGERRPCDLGEIVREAVEEVRPVAEEHSLELDVEQPATVRGNPDELHRLALNLVENAVRHTPPGTRIAAAVRSDGGEAVLEVSDDGPGLPEGIEEQVFDRFVRGAGPADRSGDRQGTGLGLSIVRAVAASHGGSVAAGAAPSGGARFTVTLPIGADERVEEVASVP